MDADASKMLIRLRVSGRCNRSVPIQRLLQLPNGKQRGAMFQAPDGPFRLIDFSRVGGRWPYIVMMPQVRFLDFITSEARRFPAFRLVMSADVRHLVEEDGVVRGVRYLAEDGWHEMRATRMAAFNPSPAASRRRMCCG
jgi:hypothetical protein